MNRAYKYRIYPTKEQQEYFARCFGCCRKIWNLMLADKIAYYKETGKSLLNTPAQYKKEYPYLKEVDSLALCNVQQHLQAAYRKFFREKKVGFLKFKSRKKTKRSYTTNNVNGTIYLTDRAIHLPKVYDVRAVLHRMSGEDWMIKSVTITQTPDGKYYASVLFAYEQDPAEPIPVKKDRVLGLDYKLDGLYADSNGKLCRMPKHYRRAEQRLARLQKAFSRKKPDSRNYQKEKLRIAKLHAHVAAQRRDYLQKLSTAIAKQYDYICVEDLNMRQLSNKGFGKGKATMDNGYGMFLRMLEYKLEEKGGKLVRVDKCFPSSQICNCCGCKNTEVKDLKIRTWVCPDCGVTHDRDYNAAKNIREEGLRLLRAAA